MTLAEITPEHVSEFRLKRQGDVVKNSTINKNLQVLRKIVNLAEEFGYEVGKNPVRPFHFSNEAEFKRTRVLSEDEERLLMVHAAPHLRPLIKMAISTGMRLQELLKLKVSDVDFSRDVICIRAENNKSGKLDQIPLPCSFRDMLRLLISENGGRTEFVFNYLDPRTNEYRPIDSVQHAFRGPCRRAGIENLQFRDLRRTCATRLHEAGVDPLVIQRLLRHSSFRISEEVYIQSSLRMIREALERADGKKPDSAVKVSQNWPGKKESDENIALASLFSVN